MLLSDLCASVVRSLHEEEVGAILGKFQFSSGIVILRKPEGNTRIETEAPATWELQNEHALRHASCRSETASRRE